MRTTTMDATASIIDSCTRTGEYFGHSATNMLIQYFMQNMVSKTPHDQHDHFVLVFLAGQHRDLRSGVQLSFLVLSWCCHGNHHKVNKQEC